MVLLWEVTQLGEGREKGFTYFYLVKTFYYLITQITFIMPDHSSGKIFVLAIGIEVYDPVVTRNPLAGCRKDVQDFLAYLKGRFKADRLIIHELVDKAATRANIVSAFLGEEDTSGRSIPSFLKDVSKDDTFIFYYSGHGSTEKASSRFNMANDTNETLLTYDSRKPGMHDLADKELNFLLSTVTKRVDHVIVIVDSCHSDSVFRGDGDLSERHEPDEKAEERDFSTYLPGVQAHYSQSRKLPGTDFLTLSACQADESAWGSSTGGRFTQGLLKVLRTAENQGKIPSYFDLIFQIKAEIGNTRIQQHPQLGSWGKVNPNWQFLAKKIAEDPPMPMLFRDTTDASWFINVGAFHGYQKENIVGKKFDVYIKGNEQEGRVFEVEGVAMGIHNSLITILGNIERNPKELYVVDIPRPAFGIFMDKTDPELNGLLSRQGYNFIHKNDSNIALEATDDAYCIYYKKDKAWKLAHGIAKKGKGKEKENAQYILNHLRDIADWHFGQRLRSPESPGIHAEEVHFSFICDAANKVSKPSDEPEQFEVTLAPGKNEASFKLEIYNDTSYNLDYVLLHFDPKFNIDVWNDSGQTLLKADRKIEEEAELFITEKKVMEVQDNFFLIVSRTHIEEGIFKRSPFPEEKWGKIFDPTNQTREADRQARRIVKNVESNWLVKQIRITTKRS